MLVDLWNNATWTSRFVRFEMANDLRYFLRTYI